MSDLATITALKGEHLDEEQLASLALGVSEDRTGHLAGCAQCTAELEAQRAMLGELDALPGLEPAPEVLAAVRTEIVTAMQAPEPARVPWLTAGVVAVVGVLALMALGDFTALEAMDPLTVARWVLALGVLGGAIAIARTAARSSRHAALGLGGALGAAVGLGVLDLMASNEVIGEHLGCEQILMLAALAPLATSLFAVRRGAADPGRAALEAAAGGAAGALAGQAALFTTCSSPEGLLHVLFFHVLTFVGIAMISALLGRAVYSTRSRT